MKRKKNVGNINYLAFLMKTQPWKQDMCICLDIQII